MGSPQSKAPSVDRAGLEEEEYQQLRTRLHVSEDSPKARVGLPAFLACFPSHLAPLIQPLFFQLANAPVRAVSAGGSALQQAQSQNTGGIEQDNSMAWPLLVSGTADLFQTGASWSSLLQLWEGADTQASMDLAAHLCFWCAYPSLTPDQFEKDPVDSIIAVLRAEADIEAVGTQFQRDMPRLPGRVVPFLKQALLGPVPGIPPLQDFPTLDSRIIEHGLSFALRGIAAQLWESGDWSPLYRSWKDGRSFSGLLKGASSYPGLAVVLVRTYGNQVLGALSNCWQEGLGKFGGGPECTLFALEPSLVVLRSTGRSTNYGYLNSKSTYSKRGIGFGGQAECCRLWIDADFENGHVLKFDSTYQEGALLPGDGYQVPFKVSSLEVWGVSGSSALEEQGAFKERMGAAREQARKADRSKLIENEFDKEMFFGNTFAATKDAHTLADDCDDSVAGSATNVAGHNNAYGRMSAPNR